MRKAAATAVLGLLAGMLVATAPLVAPTASAVAGPPFDTSRPTVFVAQSTLANDPTTLYRTETQGDGTYVFTPEGSAAPGRYNAIGFNDADGYLYGVTITANGAIPANAVIRIGEGGGIERVGTYTYPSNQWVGAFGADPNLFYTTQGTATTNNALNIFNVQTRAFVRSIPIGSATTTIADFVYRDGYFWAVNYNAAVASGTITRIDPSNGNVDNFHGIIEGTYSGAWGAAWQFGNGNLGFSNNGTGDIAQIRITNPGATTPNFEVVSIVKGPPSNGNDGASIPGDPVDLGIEKSAPASFRPGGTVTYTLTVTNEGPGESSGWLVTDEVPAELTGVTADSDLAECTVDGNDVTCTGGRLAFGDSVEITITGQSTASERGCLTNTASVLGNEFDPEEANNEDSVDTCARLLEIEKESDATADTRVGDTVTYRVTATNVGSTGFTASDPAYVVDDLTGVLDDAVYNGDATASTGAAPTYSAPRLSWSGALAAGASVELEYTVTIRAAGDGAVRNVAWEPGNPDNPEPPACDPAPGGVDAVTGEVCATSEFELPALTINKYADRTELPAVGESIRYTVVVTNVGPGDFTASAPASFADDLSEVLDDATYDSSTASTGTVTYSAPELSWAGALASGQQATISYTLTYTGEGDQLLQNLACIPEFLTAAGEPSCDTVTVPGSGLTQWKQAQASDDPLVAGSTITYTLFFDNDGEAAATVDAVDNLTHVLDDAEVTVEPTSPDGLTVVRNGAEISITGSVPVGERHRVTYTVTVLPDGQRGDNIATNFLLAPDEEPPTDGVCVPTPGQLPTCTTSPISGIAYTKSVTASQSPVRTGTELTYTITVVNTGATEVEVSRDDVLTDVLDDAELTTPPTSSNPTVTVTGPTDDVLALRGTLAPGATSEVTYTATVLPAAERGNSTATNFLVPPGGTPDPVCDDEDTSCTTTPIAGYTVAKTADTQTVALGGTVTYTVTLTNVGAVAYTTGSPASFVDDLSAVLDDATYNDDVTAGGTLTGDVLRWEGALGVGDTITVTYSVTVNDPQSGDLLLRNAVTTDQPGGECDPEGECIVETPVASYTVAKEVDTTEAFAGDVVTYTVTVVNTGLVAFTDDAPASFSDDLSAVLDDATYNDDVSAGGAVADGILTWSGPLAVGATATVTYSVTIDDPIDGDQVLANVVTPTAPGGSCATDGGCETTTDVASFTVSKQADATEALPGATVTYTVTVTNTGDVDYTAGTPASFSDDLSGVLDDATYNGDVSAGGSVTASTLTWAGALAAGATTTVTYSVTIDDPVTGDYRLANVVVPTGPGGSCDGECTTETAVKSFRVVKTSDATAVIPGDVVTYTVTVTNIGRADYTAEAPASFTDDFSEVLDDAAYNGDAVSSTGAGVSYSAPVLSWSGALEAGATVTVTYSFTVGEPDSGDGRLENAVLTPAGVGGNCTDGTDDPDCESIVPAGSFTVEKQASHAEVLPGEVVTYTVTVTNTGDVAYDAERPASFRDDLSRVLDDATYNGDVSAGGAVEGSTLTWSGALAVGETIEVTYSVTVADPPQGDGQLRNVVVPTSPGGGCADDACVAVTEVASYTVAKTVDVQQATAGSVVTYALTITNTGQVAYTDADPASLSDDLSAVLDDAVYNDDATAGAGVVDGILRWSGALPVGESVTVEYSVTVSDALEGDGLLRNAVTPTTPGGVCAEGACVTETPVAAYRVVKSASADRVSIGDTVTYTITVTNTGRAAYTDDAPVSFTDDLSDVLEHATYNRDATAGAVYDAPVLSWESALAVGEEVTVTYSVTATSQGTLRNVVVTPEGTGGNCESGADAADCETETLVPPPGIPATGGTLWAGGIVAGLALLALGTWLVIRRRSHVEA